MRRARVVFGLSLLLALFGLASLFVGMRGPSPDQLPIIRAKLEEIGELRTARATYNSVFTHETHLNAEGWAAALPGAQALATGLTRNSALMSTSATVDAGFDLRRATITREGEVIIVQLPACRIFEPNVRGSVYDTKRGVFWRDESISISGLERARNEAREVAARERLEDEATENARRTLVSLLSPLAGRVEVRAAG